MSLRYPGGLITKNPVVPSTSSAAGIWTLEQALEYIKAGTWPTTSDPYFEYVTLLLHGNGTNGAQNNTFLDSSTNAFTITRNGNTTQGSFSPFSRADGGFSNYFDGDGDYLTTPNVAALRLGSGDFTVEAWINPSVVTNTYGRPICGTYEYAGNADRGWLFQLNASGYLNFLVFPAGGGAALVSITSSTITTANTWSHVAVVRSGSSIKLYLNGVEVGSATSSFDDTYAGTSFYVATYLSSGQAGLSSYSFVGNISNVRVVKGTAVYTGAFTPPTSPLTAITNTSILTCQSNRFIDNSANAFAITVNGNTSVQVFNPFNPTTAYSTTTNGGSGYFDGSGDYLTVQNNNTFDTDTTYTLEAWVYQPSSGNGTIFSRGGGASGWSTSNGLQFILFFFSGTLYFQFNSGGSPAQITTTSPSAGSWHHVAVGYNGTTTRMWVDGVSIGTSTSSYTMPTSRTAVYAGLAADGTVPLSGYISGLRFVKGTDVYGVGNTTITIPTAPPTAITNTSLLLNFTNGGIFDNAAMNDLETVGNAQISTAQSKFGGGSMYFDGSGDYLFIPANRGLPFTFGTGNFTIEFWWYPTTLASTQPLLYHADNASIPGGQYVLVYNTSLGLRFYTNGGSTGSVSQGATTGWSTNTWYHVAVVRNGTTLTIYRDGTSIASGTNSNSLGGASLPTFIGGETLDPLYSTGYIDDFRVSNGYARYTANFTPPTAPFPDK